MFSQTEKNEMTAAQTAHMMDTCKIYRAQSKTKDSRGVYVKAFAAAVESACGVSMNPTAQTGLGGGSVAGIDLVLRLPAGVSVAPGDEIEITARFGTAQTAQRFAVERFINSGVSGGRVYCSMKAVV